MKKTIEGDYCITSAATMTRDQKRKLLQLEGQRLHEQDARNERRFIHYNNRRINAGLAPLNYSDYLQRRYRTARFTHRDNITLETR